MTEDKRSVREILVDIESKLDKASQKPVKEKRNAQKAIYPLDQSMKDTLEIALDEIEKPFTLDALYKTMNQLSPGCVPYKSGDLNERVRYAICELQGLSVRWSPR